MLKVCLYGFISGMSLLLSGNTINFWLASVDIDTKIIGLFSCIALPYALKYFIALFIDRYSFPKKHWLIYSQVIMSIALVLMSFLNPHHGLWLIAALGFLIALCATIQDIVLNASRIEIFESHQQPTATAIYSLGYRLGMILSGAGVILASVYITWQAIYLILASLCVCLSIMIYYIYLEPCHVATENLPSSKEHSIWYNIIILPFQNFLPLSSFIWVILFIIFYRLADNMLIVMLNPFLLQLEYTAVEIASIAKFFGTIMIIIGTVISGPIIQKLTLRKSIISFSIAHIFGYLLFIILNITGKNILLLYFITAYEGLSGGMMMTAYIAFISSLCKGKYLATQYALLSSGIGISRVLFPMMSGIIVEQYNWSSFFMIIIVIAIFTTLFSYYIPKRLYSI